MQEKQRPTKGDLMLAAGIVMLCALLFLIPWLSATGGDTVVVEKDGKPFGRYALDEDRTVDIDSHNRLVIRDGEAFMEWADCPDGDCLRQGKLDKTGGSIVCLPHRVVITVAGDSGVDAVAGGA